MVVLRVGRYAAEVGHADQAMDRRLGTCLEVLGWAGVADAVEMDGMRRDSVRDVALVNVRELGSELHDSG